MHVHSHIFIIIFFFVCVCVVYLSNYLYSLEHMIFWSVLETVVFGRLKTAAEIVAIPSCNDNQNRTCFEHLLGQILTSTFLFFLLH